MAPTAQAGSPGPAPSRRRHVSGPTDSARTDRANTECVRAGGRGRHTSTGLEHSRQSPASSRHSAALPVATSNSKVASVDVVVASGLDVIVGAAAQRLGRIVHAKRLTLLRRPSARASHERGTHGCRGGAPGTSSGSRTASSVRRRAGTRRAVDRCSNHANVAFLEIHGSTGAVVISGRRRKRACASRRFGATSRQEYVDASLVAPTGFLARTRKTWRAGLSPRKVTGLGQAR